MKSITLVPVSDFCLAFQKGSVEAKHSRLEPIKFTLPSTKSILSPILFFLVLVAAVQLLQSVYKYIATHLHHNQKIKLECKLPLPRRSAVATLLGRQQHGMVAT